MERESGKKRRRPEMQSSGLETNTSPARQQTAVNGNAPATEKRGDFCGKPNDSFKIPRTYRYRPVGVFEFPWQKESGGLAPELEGCSFRDVFFCSLVDGCSAAIEFPGDRLSRPSSSAVILPDDEFRPSDADDGDLDSIWSSILRQPLAAVHCADNTSAV